MTVAVDVEAVPITITIVALFPEVTAATLAIATLIPEAVEVNRSSESQSAQAGLQCSLAS